MPISEAALEDLSESALLGEFEALHAAERRAEVRILVAAVEWAHQHGPETVDGEMAKLPGRQRAIRPGGEGTPEVAEFAASLMAARLELSAWSGQRLIADGLDLCHRLPRLWARVRAFEVRVGHARLVARRTRELTAEQAGYVDARVAESADGRLPWGRFVSLVEAAVIAADEEAARRREEAEAARRFAKATRSEENGMRGFYVRADCASIARIDATVAYLAEALQALGHGGDVDERRVAAVLFLANPTEAVKLLQAYHAWQTNPHADEPDRGTAEDGGQDAPVPERFRPAEAVGFDVGEERLLPLVHLFVHVLGISDLTDPGDPGDPGDLGDLAGSPECSGMGAVARVEGHGPITAAWVGRHLGPRCSFRITPTLDPLDQVPVDAYEIPVRHRNAVRVLNPADCFPYAAGTDPAHQQLDHTIPFDHRPGAPPGQSRIGNYAPMVGFHHRLKTHGPWQVKQPFPGVFVWRDGHGATYLVDHTGTRRTNPAPPRQSHPKVEPFFRAVLELAA